MNLSRFTAFVLFSLNFANLGHSQSSDLSSSPDFIFSAESVGQPREFRVPAKSSGIRLELELRAVRDGRAKFLTWGDISLAAGYKSGDWMFYVKKSSESKWVETELGFSDDNLTDRLAIELIRGGQREAGWKAILANGNLIASAGQGSEQSSAAQSKVSFFPLDFADIAVGELDSYESLPPHAKRALRRLRSKDQLAQAGKAHEFRLLHDDETRRNTRGASNIVLPVRSGELSYQEEAWMLSESVNRTYYAYDPSIRISDILQDSIRLEALGADYLPALESAGWERPYVDSNWADYYIEKLEGYIVPEESGDYRFFVSGDDTAVYFLSTDSSRGNLQKIADLKNASEQYEWNKYPSQKSKLVTLEAGTPYYFELWHLERIGADHVSIAWQLPSGGFELVPPSVLSAKSFGVPGSSYRPSLYPDKDAALFSSLPSAYPVMEKLTPLGVDPNGGRLLGSEAILLSDYNADSDNWIFHSFEAAGLGTGLGWTWSDTSVFPYLSTPDLYSNGWVWYLEGTFNPQWFTRLDPGIWFTYSTTPSEIVYYTHKGPKRWDFENDMTDWASEPTSWWLREFGGTPTSGTGPSLDNTDQSGTGHYLYLETASGQGAYLSGDEARLYGPWVEVAPNGSEMVFYYHAYGQNIGSFDVILKDFDAVETIIPVFSGEQHLSSTEAYTMHTVDLSAYAGEFVQIIFQVSAVGGAKGNIAVDDVIIYDIGVDTDFDGVPDGLEYAEFNTDPLVAEVYSAPPASKPELIKFAAATASQTGQPAPLTWVTDWMGTMWVMANAGWYGHPQHGTLFIPDYGANERWFYDQTFGWLWSDATAYPWMYCAANDDWIYVFPGDRISPNRWVRFADYKKGRPEPKQVYCGLVPFSVPTGTVYQLKYSNDINDFVDDNHSSLGFGWIDERTDGVVQNVEHQHFVARPRDSDFGDIYYVPPHLAFASGNLGLWKPNTNFVGTGIFTYDPGNRFGTGADLIEVGEGLIEAHDRFTAKGEPQEGFFGVTTFSNGKKAITYSASSADLPNSNRRISAGMGQIVYNKTVPYRIPLGFRSTEPLATENLKVVFPSNWSDDYVSNNFMKPFVVVDGTVPSQLSGNSHIYDLGITSSGSRQKHMITSPTSFEPVPDPDVTNPDITVYKYFLGSPTNKFLNTYTDNTSAQYSLGSEQGLIRLEDEITNLSSFYASSYRKDVVTVNEGDTGLDITVTRTGSGASGGFTPSSRTGSGIRIGNTAIFIPTTSYSSGVDQATIRGAFNEGRRYTI